MASSYATICWNIGVGDGVILATGCWFWPSVRSQVPPSKRRSSATWTWRTPPDGSADVGMTAFHLFAAANGSPSSSPQATAKRLCERALLEWPHQSTLRSFTKLASFVTSSSRTPSCSAMRARSVVHISSGLAR